MRKLGLSVNEHPNQLSITQQQLLPQKIHVEYDWSGVYAFLGGALLTRNVLLIDGLKADDIQGDRQLLEVYHTMGLSNEFSASGLCKSIQVIFSHDQPEMDMLDYPDQIMNLVVLLSAFKCQGSITGIDTVS